MKFWFFIHIYTSCLYIFKILYLQHCHYSQNNAIIHYSMFLEKCNERSRWQA
ncbi:hypothetical protein CLOHYLEM_06511 [[Clostridium] hylemonae DSM 15053]|uniref:Uncharacterized protein n=1 Tax=[Clostridium] hylemonae DSM 15053 TaxID=553973 RepID=C0C352_9FIRM|nr:hypothetical protein CLOHYLEM_06511 [[Clostridium] hylemonae DSM 15053]